MPSLGGGSIYLSHKGEGEGIYLSDNQRQPSTHPARISFSSTRTWYHPTGAAGEGEFTKSLLSTTVIVGRISLVLCSFLPSTETSVHAHLRHLPVEFRSYRMHSRNTLGAYIYPFPPAPKKSTPTPQVGTTSCERRPE